PAGTGRHGGAGDHLFDGPALVIGHADDALEVILDRAQVEWPAEQPDHPGNGVEVEAGSFLLVGFHNVRLVGGFASSGHRYLAPERVKDRAAGRQPAARSFRRARPPARSPPPRSRWPRPPAPLARWRSGRKRGGG